MSFIGPAWSEAALLSAGYAFEQAMPPRTPPDFSSTVYKGPELDPIR